MQPKPDLIDHQPRARQSATGPTICSPSAASQRGFALLQAALVVLLIGSAIAVGFLVLQARKPTQQIQQQERALQWADQALVAYAATYAHLPCAVTTPTSPSTACVGPGQKGWLPVQTLESVHPTGIRPGQPLRYMVYRGSNADLAQATNAFDPHKLDGSEYDFNTAINGLDMCALLAGAASQTATSANGDRARTTDIHGNAINVAYGLSAAGATAGNAGGRFDGINQQSMAAMASPSRGVGGDYDDRVRVRDFDSLARTLGCGYASAADPDGLTPASLDMLALAVDVSNEVTDQHESNVASVDQAVDMAKVSVAFATVNVALAGAGVASSGATLATAITQLSTAIGTCAVLVGCALIPPYTGAVVAGAIAVGLAAGGTVAAATALGLTVAGHDQTVEAQQMAHSTPTGVAGNPEEAARIACITAHGGMRLWTGDPETQELIPLVPPEYQEGLEQEVEALKEEIAVTEAEIEETTQTIAKFHGDKVYELIDAQYGKPVRSDFPHSNDADEEAAYDRLYNDALQQWRNQQPTLIQRWKAQIDAKIAAIDAAQTVHHAYDDADAAADAAKTDYDSMNQAIVELYVKVQMCDANPPPPSATDRVRKCSNDRHAYLGMVDCSSQYTQVNSDGEKRCQAALRDKLDDVNAVRDDLKDTLDDKMAYAYGLPSPPWVAGNYSWWCDFILGGGCGTPLIKRGQYRDDDDDTETYSRTVYQHQHLLEMRAQLEDDLANKQAAYEQAAAQCERLKAMDPDAGSSGDEVNVWFGANAILKAANCKGATGPVQPTSCGATP